MSDLVVNPDDRFSHNKAHMAINSDYSRTPKVLIAEGLDGGFYLLLINDHIFN